MKKNEGYNQSRSHSPEEAQQRVKHPIPVIAFPNQNAGPEARLLHFHDLNVDQGRAHRRHLGVVIQILRNLMVLTKTIDTELDLWLPRSGIDQKNGHRSALIKRNMLKLSVQLRRARLILYLVIILVCRDDVRAKASLRARSTQDIEGDLGIIVRAHFWMTKSQRKKEESYLLKGRREAHTVVFNSFWLSFNGSGRIYMSVWRRRV